MFGKELRDNWPFKPVTAEMVTEMVDAIAKAIEALNLKER